MKIAFLTSTLGLYGGNLIMLRYAGHLASLGHEVSVVSPQSEIECSLPAGVKLHCWKMLPRRSVFYSHYLVYLLRAARCLRSSFDVVIPVHTPFAVHALFARRLYRLHCRVILLYQDFFAMPWTGKYIKCLLGQKWLLKALDKVIAVSPGSAREFESASKVRPLVIPNGIDEVFFAKPGVARGCYVLFVGRPAQSKGFDVFTKAMALVTSHIPTVRGLLVSSAVEDGMLGEIQTVRYRDREQMKNLYAEALVYVHAAVGESFGLPPLEAMAAGTPTVITNTVGTSDYARDNDNCLAVEYGDYESMARKIVLLIQDEKLRSRVAQAGLVTAGAYKWKTSLEQFAREVTGTTPSPSPALLEHPQNIQQPAGEATR